MKKNKILIFGTGKSSELVIDSLLENTEIVAYIDNNKEKQGKIYHSKIIISPANIVNYQYDFIIIAVVNYNNIYLQLLAFEINEENIICYYSEDYYLKNIFSDLLNVNLWRTTAILQNFQVQMQKLKKDFDLKISNIEYELVSKIKNNVYKFPRILPGLEALKLCINHKYSMVRYGDGEFECMAEKQRAKFQNPNSKLANRLKEVLQSREDNIIIAIANNYEALDQYTDESANAIREYMTKSVREYHMSLLDMNRNYYDAYVSRPYLLYKDKGDAAIIFDLFRELWNNRDITIIEGNLTRIGIGNDLLSNAKSIERILAPNINAFDKYDEILAKAGEINRNNLILIALGPTATVLAYDLAMDGYQALDIGHLDIEYEWYLKDENKRVNIAYKYVNECNGGDIVDDIEDENYTKQIVAIIE